MLSCEINILKAVTCKLTLQNCYKWVGFRTLAGGIKENIFISDGGDYMVPKGVWQSLTITNG